MVVIATKNNTSYAICGGYGHTQLKEAVVPDFGVDVAKRSLSAKNMFVHQKLPSGDVFSLMRLLRGTYLPAMDDNNGLSVLKKLSGPTLNDELGARLDGGTSLLVDAKLDIRGVIGIIDKIEYDVILRKPIIEIESLPSVPNALSAELTKELYSRLDKKKLDGLVVDVDHGVRQNAETVTLSGSPCSLSVLSNIQELVESADSSKARHAHSAQVVVSTSSEELLSAKVGELVEGELSYKGTLYFRVDGQWFQVTKELIKRIESDFSNIDEMTFAESRLWAWPLKSSAIPKAKGCQCKKASKYICETCYLSLQPKGLGLIETHVQKVRQIELCDLVDPNNDRLLHIKSDVGANLRVLFSQGCVSGVLLDNDSEFRKEADSKFGYQFGKAKHVVFAIFPHKKGKKNVPDIFSLYAKIDIVQRARILRAHGYRVSYCIIDEA